MNHVIRTASATALCGAFFAFACGHIDPPTGSGNTGATGGTGPAPGTGGTTSTGGTGGRSTGGMSTGGTGAATTCTVATSGTPFAPQSIAQGSTPTQVTTHHSSSSTRRRCPVLRAAGSEVKRTLTRCPARKDQANAGVSFATKSYEDHRAQLRRHGQQQRPGMFAAIVTATRAAA